MLAVTCVGDNNTGHDACPPTTLSSGSPNVNINPTLTVHIIQKEA